MNQLTPNYWPAATRRSPARLGKAFHQCAIGLQEQFALAGIELA
jgi:hypothetical protein